MVRWDGVKSRWKRLFIENQWNQLQLPNNKVLFCIIILQLCYVLYITIIFLFKTAYLNICPIKSLLYPLRSSILKGFIIGSGSKAGS